MLGFVGILFFTAGFNFGFGALVWVYASESFPSRLRTAGASTMLTADLEAIGVYWENGGKWPSTDEGTLAQLERERRSERRESVPAA